MDLGIQFEDNSSVRVGIDETFDRLVAPFAIHVANPRVSIPVGDYHARSYTAKFSTDPSRMLAGNGNMSAGDFWDGTRQSFTGGLAFRPGPHLNIDLDYSVNRVNLPAGRFTTTLSGARFLYRSYRHPIVRCRRIELADSNPDELSTRMTHNHQYNWPPSAHSSLS